MSKYTPLEKHLKNRGYSRIPMTFGEIESIIEGQLPPSARKHRAWWSNNPTNSVITYSWLAAGYKTSDVNLEGERVVFIKSNEDSRSEKPATGISDTGEPRAHPALGCLKNTVTIPAGIDLTDPASPEWSEAVQSPRLCND